MKFIHMKSFVYGNVHPCRWIKITLNFKLQAQSSTIFPPYESSYIYLLEVFKYPSFAP